MTTQLRTEIETYLSTEKRLNNAIENYNAYSDCDSELSKMYSNQIDILEARLQEQMDIALKSFGLTAEEYVNLVNNFSTK